MLPHVVELEQIGANNMPFEITVSNGVLRFGPVLTNHSMYIQLQVHDRCLDVEATCFVRFVLVIAE